MSEEINSNEPNGVEEHTKPAFNTLNHLASGTLITTPLAPDSKMATRLP